MNQDPVKVDRVDWPAILPALHLLKALRFAYRFRALFPAACAVVLVGLVLVVAGDPMASVFSMDFNASDFHDNFYLIDGAFSSGNPQQVLLSSSWRLMQHEGIPILRLMIIFAVAQTIVFAFGVGISRAVTSEFCAEQRSSAWANLQLSTRSIPSALAAAVAFFLFCFVALLPVLTVRALAWYGVSDDVLRTAWPVVALSAVPAVLVWILVLLAGPLAAAAIATDDCGIADAVSRAFCYVLSHKLLVFLLLWASMALAWFCSSLAEQLMSVSIRVAANGLPQNVAQLKSTFWGTQKSSSIGLTVLVQVIEATVQFAVWQASFAIGYVLLRKKEDAIPYREIR